jgi:hypothetical protein
LLTKVGKVFWIWSSAFVVCLLAVAIVYTLFFGRNKVVLNEAIYENHRFVGLAGSVQLSTSEGHGRTSFGENGLIVDKKLNEDALRVLFVGDSFVKAKQVSDQEKFTEIVERKWNQAHSEQPIQTLNLGLGAQDMATYLSFGPNMDRHFEPDLVFLVANPRDFRLLARDPAKIELVASGLSGPITQPERANKVEDWANRLGIRSFVGRLQQQTFGFVSQSRAARGLPAPEESDARNQAEDRTSASSSPDLAPKPAVLHQMTALKRIWGDRLVIIYSIPIAQMGRDAQASYYDDIMMAMERENVPYVSLYEPMLEAYRQGLPPRGFNNSILGKGHFNVFGHQIIADQVIRYLETRDDLF